MAATEHMPPSGETSKASPGATLRLARQAAGLSEREAADRLKWLPCYIGIIERDDYSALRRPAFARGYVRAYGRLMGVDENSLLAAFDALDGESAGTVAGRRKSAPSAPGKVSRVAIVTCLTLLALVLAGLWWWQGNAGSDTAESLSLLEPITLSEL